jgi:Holliday junction resolvase RusA-like endonuclease
VAIELQAVKAVTITIPEIPPSLNRWAGMHWAPKAQEKARWKQMVWAASVQYKPFAVPVVVTVTYFFKDRRRRDFDNFVPKFILDGLVGTVLTDDDQSHLSELRIRFAHDPKNPRTEVTLMPV